MATKISWQGNFRRFERMMKGNGYYRAHQKGTHITWKDDKGHVIVLGSDSHLRDELVWNMIRKYNLDYKPYI